jgi:hypothetical protein
MSYTKVERSVRRVACLFCVPRSLLALFANLVGVTSAEDSHWHNLITSSREEHLMRLYFAFASFWHFPPGGPVVCPLKWHDQCSMVAQNDQRPIPIQN